MAGNPSTAIRTCHEDATKRRQTHERSGNLVIGVPMKLTTLALSALVLAMPASAFAQDQHGGGMHGFFTPEQREMYMEQQKANGTDWSSMTPDQRHAQFQAMRAKFDAMSDADKQKMRSDMQAKFDSLTPDQKKAVEDKIAEHMHHHDMNGQRS
jgi:hypothetical protein